MAVIDGAGDEAEIEFIMDLPRKERIQYYVAHKVSPTLAKYIEDLLSGKDDEFEQNPYEHYYKNISLFKAHYCEKDLIPFQEQVLTKIRQAIKQARARGLEQVIILILVPKRHGKTEGIVQPLLTHWIVHNKEKSYKYISETQELAIQKIAPIREMFAETKHRIQDYGPFKTSDWSKTRFTIQRKKHKPDPTLMAWGIFSQKMGQNSDGQILDDPASADMSFDVVKRIHDAINGEILNTRNPQCVTVVIATRKGPEDIPGMWLNEECPFCDHSHLGNVIIIDDFKRSIVRGNYKDPCGVITQDPAGNIIDQKILRPNEDTYFLVKERDENGRETIIDVIIKGDYQALAPERFTVKQLIMMYWQIGEQSFDRDYMNDPTAMGGNILKIKWLTGEEHPFKGFYDYVYDQGYAHLSVMSVDLALSDSPTADYTGIIEAMYDLGSCEFFQEEEWALRKPLEEIIAYIDERAQSKKFDVIIIEAVGFFAPLVEGWRDAYPHLNIIFIEKKLVGKIERISATMQPVYQLGKYHLKRSHRHSIKEYKDFPYSKDDHLLDAQQQMVDYILIQGYGQGVRVVF
jgi:hypothetical protein